LGSGLFPLPNIGDSLTLFEMTDPGLYKLKSDFLNSFLIARKIKRKIANYIQKSKSIYFINI